MRKYKIPLGHDVKTNKLLLFDLFSLIRHLWVMGATGAGKTVFLLRLFAELVRHGSCCIVIIDKMGGLAREAEKFIASQYGTKSARDRFILIRPSIEDYVLPLHPLDPNSGASAFYQVERAVDLGMRMWRSQDMALQSRLRRWSFNLLFAMRQLCQNIRPIEFLLNVRAPEHEPLIQRLKGRVRHEFDEIHKARNSEALRQLESANNRWGIFSESPHLRRMTTSLRNHLDMIKFRLQKKIVIVDLSPGNSQLTSMVADGIAGMIVNEIVSSARVASSQGLVLPEAVLFLDEFQDFVSKDLEEALPQTRQLGLSFVLSHQSMSQLEQGEADMSKIVWQAQSHAFFRNYGEDGDIVAREKAVYDYDPYRIKDKRTTKRQRVIGQELRVTHGGAESQTNSRTQTNQVQRGRGEGFSADLGDSEGRNTTSRNSNESYADVQGSSNGHSVQTSWRETYVPKLEDFEEISSLTFQQFEEVENVNRGEQRRMPVGHCNFKGADDSQYRELAVNPLFIRDTSYIRDQVAQLEAKNFESDLFIPAATIDREDELLRQQILCGAPFDFDPSSCSPPNSLDRAFEEFNTNDGDDVFN